METFAITLSRLKELNAVSSVPSLVKEFRHIFSETLVMLKSVQAKTSLKEGAKPKFFKARQVPSALRDRVIEELQGMQREGIVHPV